MTRSLPAMIRSAAQPLPSIEDKSFGSFFDSFGGSRVVLIGDASHGTSEFYRARANITKHLIQNHGFNTIAIEADWPDAKSIDRYVRLSPSKSTTSDPGVFKRFPQWMWRNTETRDFINWLRIWNTDRLPEERTSFNGLDLYSLSTSIFHVKEYLDRVDPELGKMAKKRYSCLEPWLNEPALYGREAFLKGIAPCEKGVIDMLKQLLENRLELSMSDGEDFFDAEMNARVVRDAESYYRAMFYGSDDSWNLRDEHFFNTLVRLFQNRRGAKAVVWAHNSHVGDARFTDMGESRNKLNIGQLCKELWGDECSIIGCGTHTGTVAAAHEWGDSMEIMWVNPSREDSYERVMHDTEIPSFMLDLRRDRLDEEVRRVLTKRRLERFIGVIYRPKTERWSHYSSAILPRQLDCYLWFDETEAVHAFETAQPDEPLSVGETYPFGL